MKIDNPDWKIWLHEFVHREYDDNNISDAINKIVEDVNNTTKEYCGNMTYTVNMVNDLIILLGYTISEMNNKNSTYYTVSNADGSNTYILLEMENEQNINKTDLLNRIGLVTNKHKLSLYFSVILPRSEKANQICSDIMKKDVVSKIQYMLSLEV